MSIHLVLTDKIWWVCMIRTLWQRSGSSIHLPQVSVNLQARYYGKDHFINFRTPKHITVCKINISNLAIYTVQKRPILLIHKIMHNLWAKTNWYENSINEISGTHYVLTQQSQKMKKKNSAVAKDEKETRVPISVHDVNKLKHDHRWHTTALQTIYMCTIMPHCYWSDEGFIMLHIPGF